MLQSLSTHAALAVVQAAIFARFFQYWRLSSVIQAIIIAALLWLAFVVPSFVVNGVYAGRSRTLLAIESAYFLLTLEAMALVFAWLL